MLSHSAATNASNSRADSSDQDFNGHSSSEGMGFYPNHFVQGLRMASVSTEMEEDEGIAQNTHELENHYMRKQD